MSLKVEMKSHMVCGLVALVFIMVADAASPVQKVVQLLGECKAKVESDLAAETKGMEEFTKYCDDEAKDKAYAIETATRGIEEASAVSEDMTATIAEMEDEIATLSSVIANKEKELSAANEIRKGQNADFQDAEKELVQTVDELSRAAAALKKGASLAQTRGGQASFSAQTRKAVAALSTLVDAEWIDAGSKRSLQSLLQTQANAGDDDDLSLTQPQGKEVAYESSSGAIIQMIEDMQGKAEDELSGLRKKEMEESNAHSLVAAGLEDEINNNKEKLSTASKTKAGSEQKLEDSNAQLVEVQKTKKADEDYVESLKGECQTKATEYEERMKSGKEEMAAISKASQILEEGVTAFLETGSRTRRMSEWVPDDDDAVDESSDMSAARSQVVSILKNIAEQRHSFVFAQMASMASSDPFEKIRGLINDMIEKLLKEAEADATHEAFCNEEMGKTKKSQEDKTMKLDKFSARLDDTESQLAELTQSIKVLQKEIGEIDGAQAEATAIRTKENEEYQKASKDFKDSATAVAQAIEVLQNFYGGASLLQLSSSTSLRSRSRSRERSFESKQGDAASVIIGVLEMSQEDFTSLLAEAESAEAEAQSAYDKMTTENKVAKATKMAEAKGKESQVKGLTNQLSMNKEDKESTSKELDAVLAYLDKLKPECESKTMSYEERKAAREAEIDGLKEALTILEGKGVALLQEGTRLRRTRRA